MRRHLNTLYVTTETAMLHKDGENIVVRVKGSEKGRTPIHLLDGVVCFGAIGITPALVAHCARSGVTLSLLSRTGRFSARIEGPVSGNVLLRRAQYRAADDPAQTAGLAGSLVIGKIVNQRAVVRRMLRDHRAKLAAMLAERLENCERRLTQALRHASKCCDVDSLRGIEGEAARAYYGVFGSLILSDRSSLTFTRRSRRPPTDPVNALLSFLYTLLVHDCRSALESVGLDPAVGYLHRDRPGRPSLALDLIEELRPVLADRLALSLINRRQLDADDFETAVSGAVNLTERARKALLVAYQERKRDELTHPFLKEKTTVGLVPFLQATMLARCLRGDLDGYPPFVWK